MESKLANTSPCPNCLEHAKELQQLSCVHCLCKNCVDRIKSQTKIQCPKCNAFSDLENIKPETRVAETIAKQPEEGLHIAPKTTDMDKCKLCTNDVVAHWCSNCTKWICEQCKVEHHNSTNTKDHAVRSLAIEHNQLKSKLDKQSRVLNAKIKEHQSSIKELQDAIGNSRHTETISLKTSGEMRNACLHDVNHLFDVFDAKILDFIESSTNEFEQQKAKLELGLKELESKANEIKQQLAPEDIAVALNGQILLEATKQLVAGLTQEQVQLSIDTPTVNFAKNKEWNVSEAVTVELSVGSTVQQVLGVGKKVGTAKVQGNLTLSDVSNCKWNKVNEQEISSCAYAIRVLRRMLWCCHDDGITLYNGDLEVQKTMPFGDLGQVYDVAEMSNGDFVIAAENGLYHWDSTLSHLLYTIVDYSISSICIQGNKVYAPINKTRDIRVYEYNTSGLQAWTRTVQRIKLPCTDIKQQSVHWASIILNANQIIAFCAECNKRYIMSINGDVISTFGEVGAEVGQLNGPYVGDGDEFGSTLLADSHNNRLQVMTRDGECSVVDLQQAVTSPRCAVRFEGHLFVASEYDEKLYKYKM